MRLNQVGYKDVISGQRVTVLTNCIDYGGSFLKIDYGTKPQRI